MSLSPAWVPLPHAQIFSEGLTQQLPFPSLGPVLGTVSCWPTLRCSASLCARPVSGFPFFSVMRPSAAAAASSSGRAPLGCGDGALVPRSYFASSVLPVLPARDIPFGHLPVGLRAASSGFFSVPARDVLESILEAHACRQLGSLQRRIV